MAKLLPSVLSISGKMDDVVHVASKRYERHVRKPVPAGSKKNEPALKKQYSRTGYLNGVAAEINRIIKANSDTFKSPQFYEQLNKRFRKEPLDNRFLLLLQLKGMEVNADYPLSRFGGPHTAVRALKSKIVVALQVLHHPETRYKSDCYFYEVLLVTWSSGSKPAMCERQISDWISANGGRPEFEFEFARRPGTVHWLLSLRVRMGLKEELIGGNRAEGMQLVDVGSFNKKDWETLKKRGEEREARLVTVVKKEETVRVKAKRVV